jgi:hypothetical protein
MSTMKNILLSVSILPVACRASKDNTYYSDGIANPNIDNPYYWRDSMNVLQDLSQFSKLYVQYHGCTWSAMLGNDDDGDGLYNCGPYNWDEEDLWYLGKTACMRANVAYSLYGILKGDEDLGCRKANFINSFFTTGGVESWIKSMQSLGDLQDFTTNSAVADDDDGDRRELYGDFANAYDKKVIGSYCTSNMPSYDDDYSNSGGGYGECNGCILPTFDGVSSYGVGCAANGKFNMFKYDGVYCNSNNVVKRLDKLRDFNNAVESQKCVPVYDSTSGSYNNNDNNGDDDDSYGGSLQVLQKSRACHSDFTANCPDPYNKLKVYAKALNKATKVTLVGKPKASIAAVIFTALMFLCGTVLLLLTFDSRGRRIRGYWNWMVDLFYGEDDSKECVDDNQNDDDGHGHRETPVSQTPMKRSKRSKSSSRKSPKKSKKGRSKSSSKKSKEMSVEGLDDSYDNYENMDSSGGDRESRRKSPVR